MYSETTVVYSSDGSKFCGVATKAIAKEFADQTPSEVIIRELSQKSNILIALLKSRAASVKTIKYMEKNLDDVRKELIKTEEKIAKTQLNIISLSKSFIGLIQ